MKLTNLKSNPNNPRIIKDDKFNKLVKSISDFPQMMDKRPIVCVTDTDGKLYPLGGNMRLKALQELKYKEIPDSWIMLADEWTAEQRNEFVIKDNVGFGEWDWDDLANNWDAEKLEEWGLDIPNFEPEVLEAEEDDYEVPDEIKTDIVLGDLFEIGEHRLLCGDSTDSDQVAKLMNGEKADFGFCDPPYNLGFRYNSYDDNKTDEEYEKYSFSWFNNLFINTERQCVTLGTKNIPLMSKLNEVTGVACWIKKNWITSCKISKLQQWEPIFFYGDYTKHKRVSDLFEINRVVQNDVGNNHTCPKQIKLIIDIFENYSEKHIVDLFLGSGTSMVASHQLKRKCYGMELDPKYCQVIVDRMLKLDPTLEIKRNGQPYKQRDNNG